jgi:5,10-methylenetetrahydromethanopterin reductase
MRFSYCMLPDYPLGDSIEMIKTADELGYYACYAVDETWHKDLWCLFAAAADKTRQIRFGPNVTHVFLREPTLICQQLATLDELSGGRAEAVVSTGNFVMMEQYHLDWAHRRPLSRLREAMHVMRTFLDDGKIDFEGDFFRYTGLFTAARPVQDRIPLKMGGMKGPRSFEAAGEIADGLHHALSYSREAYDYVVDHVKKGAERAGRNWQDLDLGAWIVSVVSEDSAAAKEAARILVAFYIPSMPPEQLARHGIDQAELQPIFDAFAAGDVAKAINMFGPELAERLSVAGTPEECAEQINQDIIPAGINHVVLALADAPLVELFSGQSVAGVPPIVDQLRLVAERLIPAVAARPSVA